MQTLMPTIRPTMLVPGIGGFTIGSRLWDVAGFRPSLDLQLADTKSLVDATTGAQLVTFTRASSGTFVGSDGLIRTAVTNLLLRSEEFDNASWSKVNATVTANSIAAPNGTVTADTLTDSNDGAAAIHSATSQNQSFVSGLSYAVSIYAKAGTQPGLEIVLPGAAFTSNLSARFNISTGTVASVSSGATASISAVGDNWYRCSILATATTTASTATSLQFRLATASTGFYQGNGTGTIFLWGAQLEQSSTVGEYIPTTSTINSAPRFDHNPTTGESLGLLVEEQRTNLLTYSELFNASPWAPGSLSVASTTATTSPAGINTAIRFTENTVAAQFHFINYPLTKAASAIQYTVSSYGKAGEREVIISAANGATGSVARFNLATGVITAVATGYGGGFTAQGSTITPVGNGWYRFSMTFTTDTTTGLVIQFALYNTALATNVYTGDGTSGVFLWGAQLEAGAFPTSYIPTTTASVTRSADVASITGTAFSSWYRQDEGTVFSAFSIPTSVTAGGARVYNISNSSNTTQAWLRLQGGTNRLYEVTDSSTQQAVLSAGTFIAGVVYRGAVAIKTNDFGFSDNGSTPTVDNSGTLGTVDRMGIGMDANGIAPLNGHLRRLTYWPTRLPNSTLQAVTQ